MGLSDEELKKKLVGFGCDGVGKKGGISAFLKQLQASCITVHCFAHRLELAYKDAVKENKLYDSCIVLLLGLYYFYHNSPKQRQLLKWSFPVINCADPGWAHDACSGEVLKGVSSDLCIT